MGDLTGRTVVVTGAGGGIGRAACERLLADGARVVALDLDPSGVVASCATDRIIGVACDVGDEASVEAAMVRAAEEFGPLTGLFASAGIGLKGRLHEMPLADWDRTIRVNLTGVFLSVKHVLPSMMAAGGGSIVTTGSISSVLASPGGAVSYKASKAGVNLLTKTVAVEYADHGVRANCLCPGAVETGFGSPAAAVGGAPSPVSARAPLRRKAAPAEIASIVSFLLSEESSYMTGATVMADGGFTAG